MRRTHESLRKEFSVSASLVDIPAGKITWQKHRTPRYAMENSSKNRNSQSEVGLQISRDLARIAMTWSCVTPGLFQM